MAMYVCRGEIIRHTENTRLHRFASTSGLFIVHKPDES